MLIVHILTQKKIRKIYYENNKEEINERTRQYRENNTAKIKRRQRKYNLKKRFGITEKEYWNMFTQQLGRCNICGREEREIHHGKVKMLAVDHNHKTGNVRGLLCKQCNLMIGNSNENPLILINGIKYLQKNGYNPF